MQAKFREQKYISATNKYRIKHLIPHNAGGEGRGDVAATILNKLMIKQMNLDHTSFLKIRQKIIFTLRYHGIYDQLKDVSSYSELYSMIKKGTHKSIWTIENNALIYKKEQTAPSSLLFYFFLFPFTHLQLFSFPVK